MIRKSTIPFLIFFSFFSENHLAYAQRWDYQTRGHLFARINSYKEKTVSNFGQQTRLHFEQSLNVGKNFSALNQVRSSSNSLNLDLSNAAQPSESTQKKESFETYLGENYLKYKSENWVTLLGYQEVVWGEAFGLNYADIIGPKDHRETLYSDASDARLPLLMFNGKSFFSIGNFSGSLQFIFSPEPRFSKTLPLTLFASNQFSNMTLKVNKEKTPELFKKTEIGGRFAGSYAGLDFSVFTFSYFDRDPHYKIANLTSTTINFDEVHNKISSTGISLAKTFSDFVFRMDLVLNTDKNINYIQVNQLKSFSTNAMNTVISLDTPNYQDYSGVLVFAQSSINDYLPYSFRDKKEQFLIGKISKNLGNDRNLEFSYTRELAQSGYSMQSFITWPINSTTDLKFGGQYYHGNESSMLNKYKNISSLFFSLKNYFQL